MLDKMADVTKVKEVVKESLLGSELPADVQLSAQSKATFDKNARKDEKTGELFMSEEEFINAIAPEGEDYVRYILLPLFSTFF
jgi:solute carrier family 25 (mitochondrial aspartate/glutamate transporter), member 12/13